MTTKPVPSTDPADLALNAGLIDKFVHDPASTFADRFGVSRLTRTGLAALFPNAAADAADAAAFAAAAAASAATAEDARDAAVIQPGLYATESAGRAAVADGQAFKVQGSGDVAAFEYRRTGASTSVLLASYPSSAAVTALATRATDLESASAFMPGSLSDFRVIRRLQLFGADTAKFYSVKFFFRNDSGTRFNFTINRHDDADGTGATEVASFSTSGVDYTGLREFTLAAVGGSGITGTLVVDFTAAPSTISINTAPASSGQFRARAIRADCLVASAAEAAYATARVDAAFAAGNALSNAARLPFADEMNTAALRALVRDLWVYGANPKRQYIVSGFSLEEFVSFSRLIITIRDITAGVDVCRYSFQTASATSIPDFVALLPSVMKLTDAALSPKSQIYAVMTVNWSGVVAPYVGSFTTMAGAGIHPSRTLADEDVADYLGSDRVDEVIRVGAGQEFTTLRAAVESLYVSGSDKGCNRSHYHHRILIDLVDDGTYSATFLTIPEFVEVRGNGVDRTFIVKESNDEDALLEVHLDTKFRDCTILSDTGDGGSWAGEYSLHSDDINRFSRGGKAQNRRLRQSFKRMKLTGGSNQAAPLFGCGVSSGQVITFDDVLAEHRNHSNSTAAFFFHNTGPTLSTPGLEPSYKPGLVEMRGCRSPDPTSSAVYVQSLEAGPVCRLVLHGCDFNLVRQDVASGAEVITDRARDRFGWEIGGVHAGAILQTDPVGMVVLATTPGVAVSGSAAALIFGTVDELGRGDLWVKTGTTKSLGARLGDCSTVSKALTIGAQTYTFNTNLTAVANSTIIAAINATITVNPVSEVDIQTEIYPDTGFTRRMLNSTGATILAGRFVKRTGANTIALASGDDDVFGLVVRPILNGVSGGVITSRSIHSIYIAGASSDGRFGVTAGLLDFGASAKKGVIAGGIARLY